MFIKNTHLFFSISRLQHKTGPIKKKPNQTATGLVLVDNHPWSIGREGPTSASYISWLKMTSTKLEWPYWDELQWI